MRYSLAALLLLLCSSMFGQQVIVTVPREPANLDVIKKQLTRYHSCTQSDCYLPQIGKQTDIAITFLRNSVSESRRGAKLALVLDVDETALSNWRVEEHDDFGYIQSDFSWCVQLRCGTAIAGTLRLYREAEKDKVTVFFITGRPETQRADTEANLKAVGYVRFRKMYMRPVNYPVGQSLADYKSSRRAEIARMGYRIILNVGDQLSDLIGDPKADHSVKLPNPFYLIP